MYAFVGCFRFYSIFIHVERNILFVLFALLSPMFLLLFWFSHQAAESELFLQLSYTLYILFYVSDLHQNLRKSLSDCFDFIAHMWPLIIYNLKVHYIHLRIFLGIKIEIKGI